MVGVAVLVSNVNEKMVSVSVIGFPAASCTADLGRDISTRPSAPDLVTLNVYVSPVPCREPESMLDIPASGAVIVISDSARPCTGSVKVSVNWIVFMDVESVLDTFALLIE